MQFESTLKALANFSPGFALKPWGMGCMFVCRNSEGVATASRLSQRNPFRVCLLQMGRLFPGLPKRNPGLKLANAFSVKRN